MLERTAWRAGTACSWANPSTTRSASARACWLGTLPMRVKYSRDSRARSDVLFPEASPRLRSLAGDGERLAEVGDAEGVQFPGYFGQLGGDAGPGAVVPLPVVLVELVAAYEPVERTERQDFGLGGVAAGGLDHGLIGAGSEHGPERPVAYLGALHGLLRGGFLQEHQRVFRVERRSSGSRQSDVHAAAFPG